METRIRIDPQLIKSAARSAKEDGFSDLASLVNHVLRLYVRGQLRLGIVADPELTIGGGDAPVALVGKSPPALAPIKWVEVRDPDGFLERVPVEEGADATKSPENTATEDSLFEGTPLMPVVRREMAWKLKEVLKIEVDLFKDPDHQPAVAWIDSRGDRWDEGKRMLDRLGERRTQ